MIHVRTPRFLDGALLVRSPVTRVVTYKALLREDGTLERDSDGPEELVRYVGRLQAGARGGESRRASIELQLGESGGVELEGGASRQRLRRTQMHVAIGEWVGNGLEFSKAATELFAGAGVRTGAFDELTPGGGQIGRQRDVVEQQTPRGVAKLRRPGQLDPTPGLTSKSLDLQDLAAQVGDR